MFRIYTCSWTDTDPDLVRGYGDEFGLLLVRPDGGLSLSHDPPQGPFGMDGGNELVPALRDGSR